MNLDALTGPAIKAVLGDSVLAPLLSPVASSIATIAGDVISAQVGNVETALSSELESLDSGIADEIGSVVSAASDLVPIVGAAVKMLTAFVDGQEGAIAASQDASEQQTMRVFSELRPTPLYGSELRPADIFARAIKVDPTGMTPATYVTPIDIDTRADDTNVQMSALGQALIRLTEPDGVVSTPQGLFAPIENSQMFINQAMGDMSHWWRLGSGFHPESRGGLLSDERRDQFKLLRRAIQAQAGKGDGGRSLWPLYMDLLRIEHESGALEDKWIRFFLGYDWLCGVNPDNPGLCIPSAPPGWRSHETLVGSGIAEQIIGMIRTWENTVNPVYQDDKAKQAQIVKALGQARAKLVTMADTKAWAEQHLATPVMQFHFSRAALDAALATIRARNAARTKATANTGRAAANAEASAAGAAYGASLEAARRVRILAALTAKGIRPPRASQSSLWAFWAALEGIN